MIPFGGPYAIAAAAIGFVVAVGVAYYKGSVNGGNAVRVEWNLANEAARQAQEADRKKQQGAANRAGNTESASQEKVRVIYRTIKEKVNDEIAKTPPPADCRLSDGLLDAWNARLANWSVIMKLCSPEEERSCGRPASMLSSNRLRKRVSCQ